MPVPDPMPFFTADLLSLAARAVARIDLLGSRGATRCSVEEIEAMALLLALGGTIPTPVLVAARKALHDPSVQP